MAKPIGRDLGEKTEAQIVALKNKFGVSATAIIRIAIAQMFEREGVKIEEVGNGQSDKIRE